MRVDLYAAFPSTTRCSTNDLEEATAEGWKARLKMTQRATGKHCPEFPWAACHGSEFQSESCQRAGQRRVVRWLPTKLFSVKAVSARVFQILSADWGSEFCNIPPERTETFLEVALYSASRWVHKHLKKHV